MAGKSGGVGEFLGGRAVGIAQGNFPGAAFNCFREVAFFL
jgi:hypothetical protein